MYFWVYLLMLIPIRMQFCRFWSLSYTVEAVHRMQQHDWSSTSPKGAHVTLSLSPLHWLPVCRLASSSRHWCLHIEQSQAQHPPTSTHYYELISPPESPAYFHSLLRIYIPSRSLRSASERRLVVPSQRGSKSLSRNILFHRSWPGGMIFPPPSGILDPCQFSSNNWKLISFQHYLTT